jgi:hypothetical protein
MYGGYVGVERAKTLHKISLMQGDWDMVSDIHNLARCIVIVAYKRNSVEKVGFVEHIEKRGLKICTDVQKAKAFVESETCKMLQECKSACPDLDFLEFRMDNL